MIAQACGRCIGRAANRANTLLKSSPSSNSMVKKIGVAITIQFEYVDYIFVRKHLAQ